MKTTLDHLAGIENEQDKRAKSLCKVYRPSPGQEPIHRCTAHESVVRGGKRSGKSVAVSREFTARVTGEPVIDSNGVEIPLNFPAPSIEYPRKYWVIGWDTKHIGQTIYRLLFERGQGGSYRVIQDLKTGLWRTWNRADKSDVARVRHSALSEPLIPQRLLKGGFENAFDWEDKKAKQFNCCYLNNGAEIYAFPSSARNPKQGDAVSGIWIDEDIQFPHHLKEWQDRLPDEQGWLMWSVWPHMKNEALLDLLARAEAEEMNDEANIRSFQLIMSENPFLADEGKKQSLDRMGSDEEIKRRDRGELLLDSLSMYQFSPTIHQIQRPLEGVLTHFDPPEMHQLLADIYLQNGQFPRDWTRYVSIDPSNTRTACHSWVVPPREYKGYYLGYVAIAEWELVARRFTAEMLAKEIYNRSGSYHYEAFIMDRRAGRQTHAGREENTFALYEKAFRKVGLKSRSSMSSFIPGCDIPQQRYAVVREMLVPQDHSQIPQLLFIEEKNLETKREFAKYRKKIEKFGGGGSDNVLDEPSTPRLFDCMASVEYFAAYIEPMFQMNQAYVDPDMYQSSGSKAFKYAKKILERRQNREGSSDVVVLGSGNYDGFSSHSGNNESPLLYED